MIYSKKITHIPVSQKHSSLELILGEKMLHGGIKFMFQQNPQIIATM
jgi:hypothetical protein